MEPEISSGDLILAGPADDVWIFQMASVLTDEEGRQVVLIGGAQASNVFWPLGTSAALVTSPVSDGAEEAGQSITFIAGPAHANGTLARVGAVAAGCGTVEELGGGKQWQ
jgi:hypothetical protein